MSAFLCSPFVFRRFYRTTLTDIYIVNLIHYSRMSWIRPFQATLSGAAITLGSTIVSCGLAIQVEASAHRLLFWCAPEKYANVEYAYGLEQSQLDSVRHLARPIKEKNTVLLEKPQQTLSRDESPINIFSEETIFGGEKRSEQSGSPSNKATTYWFQQATKEKISGIQVPSAEALLEQDIVACSMTG